MKEWTAILLINLARVQSTPVSPTRQCNHYCREFKSIQVLRLEWPIIFQESFDVMVYWLTRWLQGREVPRSIPAWSDRTLPSRSSCGQAVSSQLPWLAGVRSSAWRVRPSPLVRIYYVVLLKDIFFVYLQWQKKISQSLSSRLETPSCKLYSQFRLHQLTIIIPWTYNYKIVQVIRKVKELSLCTNLETGSGSPSSSSMDLVRKRFKRG